MELRKYISERDFDDVKSWIGDERTHAMWCAGRFTYPLEKADFDAVLATMASERGETPFIATIDDGSSIGFFCYSLNRESKEGMLKFIVVNPEFRGRGAAQEMLKTAASYAFEITGVEAVHLNVFSVNIRAKKCYQKAGFTERSVTEDAFSYKDESWGRCNMILNKKG